MTWETEDGTPMLVVLATWALFIAIFLFGVWVATLFVQTSWANTVYVISMICAAISIFASLFNRNRK